MASLASRSSHLIMLTDCSLSKTDVKVHTLNRFRQHIVIAVLMDHTTSSCSAYDDLKFYIASLKANDLTAYSKLFTNSVNVSPFLCPANSLFPSVSGVRQSFSCDVCVFRGSDILAYIRPCHYSTVADGLYSLFDSQGHRDKGW